MNRRAFLAAAAAIPAGIAAAVTTAPVTAAVPDVITVTNQYALDDIDVKYWVRAVRTTANGSLGWSYFTDDLDDAYDEYERACNDGYCEVTLQFHINLKGVAPYGPEKHWVLLDFKPAKKLLAEPF